MTTRRQGHSAGHRRIHALLLLDDGWTAERVAEALFIDAETVGAHRRLYAAGGRAGVDRLAYAGHARVLGKADNSVVCAWLNCAGLDYSPGLAGMVQPVDQAWNSAARPEPGRF